MKTVAQIKELSKTRLEEAEILCTAGKYDGAFYLAGYSIELMLKAKVCEHMGIENLFDFDEKSLPHGVREIRQAIKTHDITVLLMLSGLRIRFDTAKSNHQTLFKTNSLLFENTGKCKWSEQTRYQLGLQEPDKVQELISLLKNEEGVLKWIDKS